MRWLGMLVLVTVAGCGGGSEQSGQNGQGAPPESEPPVALNADMPIAYPPTLYEQKVEGDVTLRLFVDSTGRLIPESTRVAEPSGFAALDSAAIAGSARLRFAPGKRNGIAVATAFLQPVEFRQIGTTRTGTVTLPPPPPPPPQPVAPLPAAPPPAAQPTARPPAPPPPQPRPDTTRADTTRRPVPPAPPPQPPPPPPPPPAPDTTKSRPDTTKSRTDSSAATH
ncbi:MAG TPA: energy transducer TonB [Gemmatimonadales bacterium]|nr:energy transducer TonB [Gemmatimonadales bacterium]